MSKFRLFFAILALAFSAVLIFETLDNLTVASPADQQAMGLPFPTDPPPF
jgi:hypothetical protein